MSEMFCAARKEQESRCLFAYSGDYLSGKNAFQNSSSSVVFGVLKQLDSSKLKKNYKANHASNTDARQNPAKI